MRRSPETRLLNALVAITDMEVADFLVIHLEDRGFAVAVTDEAEVLARFAPGADVMIAEYSLWKQAAIPPAERAGESLFLSSCPSMDEAIQAAGDGAIDYLAVPFSNPRRLGRILDEVAQRARMRVAAVTRVAEPELEPVG